MGSRTEPSLCFFVCGSTALMTPSKPSGEEPELIKRAIFVALAKWEMESLPICIHRGLATAAGHCALLENKRDKV